MKLSIIIVNHNVRYFLELCLISVNRAIAGLDAEIIVVDNASTDSSLEMIRQSFPNVQIIANRENVGFSKANNIGVEVASGEFVCILNPDTVVGENCYKNLLEFAHSTNNLGILGCRLVDGGGRFLNESKRRVPTPKVAIKKLLGVDKDYYDYSIKEDENSKTEILVGAFMLLKKSVYKAVGGFDADYFMYGEDIDLSYKILKAGYDNYYVGSEPVIHFKGESTPRNSRYLKHFFKSMQIFYKKHFSRNVIVDAMVWMVIRVFPYLRSDKPTDIQFGDKTVLFSKPGMPNLLKQFGENVELQIQISTDRLAGTFIFNIDSFPFDEIIRSILDLNKKGTSKIRFYVPNSAYLIGSDLSTIKGEATLLNE